MLDGVMQVPEVGPLLDANTTRDVVQAALTDGARVVAIPSERLDPAFFDLRSGLAGDIVQTFVNYRLRLVIVGRLPAAALGSRAFAAFVREANRGTQAWFVPSLDALGDRLARDPAFGAAP